MGRSVRNASVFIVLTLMMLVSLRGIGSAEAQPSVSGPQLELPTPAIRTSPSPQRLLVNLETWLALDMPWTAITVPATETPSPAPPGSPPPPEPPPAGRSLTLRATPWRVEWEPGDGARFFCYGPGTQYNRFAAEDAQRPTCSHTYTRSSANQPGNAYTVKARIQWTVDVLQAGSSQPLTNEFPTTTTTTETSTKVKVGEIQALDPGFNIQDVEKWRGDSFGPGQLRPGDLYISPDDVQDDPPKQEARDERESQPPKKKDNGGILGSIKRGPGNALDGIKNAPDGAWSATKATGRGAWSATKAVGGFGKDVVVGVGKAAWGGVKFVVWDVPVGFWKGAWLAVGGLYTMGRGVVKLIGVYDIGEWFVTGKWSLDNFAKNWRGLGSGVKTVLTTNPWTTLKVIGGGLIAPIVEDWKAGRYGEAIGRGGFEVVSLVFGGKGLDKLNKLRAGSRAAKAADGLSDAERAAKALKAAQVAEEAANASRLAKAAAAAGEVGEEAVKKKWTTAMTRDLGKWGEDELARVFDGAGTKPRSPLVTSDGNRYVDRLVNGIAHEAKAGSKVKLTPEIKRQILKDVELVKTQKVDGAFWHFFQDADPKVLDLLTEHKIPYKVYKLTAPKL